MKTTNTVSPMAAHEQTSLLLPWYVNGSLSPNERQHVQEHLRACAECRQQQAELAKLALAARALSTPVLAPPQAAFNRLMQRLDGETSRKKQGRNKPGFWQRVGAGLGRFTSAAAAQPAWAVAVLLLAVLAAPAGFWLQSGPGGMSTDASFRTLSDPPRAGADGVNVADAIQVIFAADVGAKQRARILAGIRAETLAGPNAQGVYVIRIGSKSGVQADIGAALAVLRRETGVLFAEPALPMPGPVAATQDGKT